MAKIKNWSPLESSEYSKRQYSKIWSHDHKDRRVVVKKKVRPRGTFYDVYVLGGSNGTNFIHKNLDKQKTAKDEAKRWMRNNPLDEGKQRRELKGKPTQRLKSGDIIENKNTGVKSKVIEITTDSKTTGVEDVAKVKFLEGDRKGLNATFTDKNLRDRFVLVNR